MDFEELNGSRGLLQFKDFQEELRPAADATLRILILLPANEFAILQLGVQRKRF